MNTIDINYYSILGLPSGFKGSKLSIDEISKAYKRKALLLHPDKNRNDPNANSKFTELNSAYEVLKNESSRKIFDDLLKLRREKELRDGKQDEKRRRMVSDLEERERRVFDPEKAGKDEEERMMAKLREEVRRFKEKMGRKKGEVVERKGEEREGECGAAVAVDKSKVLKVSWVKGGDYTAARLRELFEEFGEVEDVVIRKRHSAFVVMRAKDGVTAATGQLIGDLSNLLLVLPLEPVNPTPSVRAHEPMATKDDDPLNVVGAGYQAYENSILEKLKKAAQNQNQK